MNEEEKFWKAHEELLASDDDEDEPFNHAAFEDARYEYLTDLEIDD